MGTLDIGYGGNLPTAQSQNGNTVTHKTQEQKTQEQMEKIIREKWALLDEMLEPGQYL